MCPLGGGNLVIGKRRLKVPGSRGRGKHASFRGRAGDSGILGQAQGRFSKRRKSRRVKKERKEAPTENDELIGNTIIPIRVAQSAGISIS